VLRKLPGQITPRAVRSPVIICEVPCDIKIKELYFLEVRNAQILLVVECRAVADPYSASTLSLELSTISGQAFSGLWLLLCTCVEFGGTWKR